MKGMWLVASMVLATTSVAAAEEWRRRPSLLRQLPPARG